MNNTNTGGPAFPVGIEAFGEDKTGMTLRDYFAAKAIEGLLAGGWRKQEGTPDVNEFTKRAYEFADSMLKAREA